MLSSSSYSLILQLFPVVSDVIKLLWFPRSTKSTLASSFQTGSFPAACCLLAAHKHHRTTWKDLQMWVLVYVCGLRSHTYTQTGEVRLLRFHGCSKFLSKSKHGNKKKTCLEILQEESRALKWFTLTAVTIIAERNVEKENEEKKNHRKKNRESETRCAQVMRAGAGHKRIKREMKDKHREWMEACSLLAVTTTKKKKGKENEKSCLRNSIQSFLRRRGNFFRTAMENSKEGIMCLKGQDSTHAHTHAHK